MATAGPTASASAYSSEFGGRTWLLDVDTGRHYALDGVAADIWRAIRSGLDADAIGTMVAETHGIPEDVARGDVAAFLADLRGAGLVDPA